MYVPLRVHGHHSLLTGVDAPGALLERARQLGLPALALADVDTLCGLVDFLRAAQRQAAGVPAALGPGPEPPRPFDGSAEPSGPPEPPDSPELPGATVPSPQESGGARSGVESLPGGPGGVRPIVAAEISDPSGEPGRLVALVADAEGHRNLCRLVSARHLGCDPGEAGSEPTDAADFDRVEAAVRHQRGLIYLVDHPRPLLRLLGRVPARRLLVAVSPAGLDARASSRALPRACATPGRARESARGRDPGRERGDVDADGAPWEAAVADDVLAAAKTPAPARAVAAAELVAAARAAGVAIVAVPDVYHALPGGARDHRVRVAIKHNALSCDLPEEWVAEEPAHLPSLHELCALFAGVPDVPGPWPVDPAELPEELRDAPAPVARTWLVARACDHVPALDEVCFPDVELEPGETAYSRLCAIAFEGARRRYRPLRPEVVRRLDHELSSIEQLGFAPYFLLVHRIAEFARAERIPCVGRGSAADSLVSYCMGLTDADPLRYRLPFERFLNPARRDRPDIDLDFCWRRRDEVIEHVYEAFGPHRTAMIATTCCFGLRSAFREAALVEGIPPAEVNTWSRRLPWAAPAPDAEDDGRAEHLPADLRGNPVARALRSTPECRDFPLGDERFQRVLRSAARLLDAPRHLGLHPGGVVVSPGPITDFVPCQRAAKGVVVTQLDKDAVEAIGLVKMDLLGNRALTVIDDCLAMLRERGLEPDLEHVPEDDPKTARVLRAGATLGCFQVESPGMRNLLKQTGAATMDDVIQAVALIRPGPAGAGMKDAYVRRFRGLEEPTPPHPRLTELLWDTHGIMLYQEDVMQAAALLAGMDMAEADLLRRSLQKRHHARLEAVCARFLAGCVENGVERADARRVWDLIANFASFAFCKAHAVTYGRIAYRTVYLKTHFPGPFLAAFLGSDTGYYASRVYVEEARRLGVAIRPPDVNKSGETFTFEDGADRRAGASGGALRVGLGQVRGLTGGTLERLLESRGAEGAFLSLPDFLARTRAHVDEVEHLVQCGALDGFDRTRPELLWRLHLLTADARRPPRGVELDRGRLAACRATPRSREEDAVRAARARTRGWRGGKNLALGNVELARGETAPLFPDPETPSLVLPGLPDLDRAERGLLEFELLGLTVTDHPVALFPCRADERLDALRAAPTRADAKLLDPRSRRPLNPIDCAVLERYAGGRVTLRGWLAASRRVRTTTGEWMRFLTFEDETGIAEVVLFPAVYRRDGHVLTDPGPHRVTGTVENDLGAHTLHAERLW